MKILVVDDDREFAEKVAGRIRELAWQVLRIQAIVETIAGPATAKIARTLATRDAANTTGGKAAYDLVVLDVNLGERAITGLDVLIDFKRCDSAWMVALLTGIDSDAAADRMLGTEIASDARRGLRASGMRNFYPDRITIMEKTADASVLDTRLEQLLLLYEHVSAQRYIFRPIYVGPAGAPITFWQIRYDSGNVMTVPDYAGYHTLWLLLKGEVLTPRRMAEAEPDSKRGTPKKNGVKLSAAKERSEADVSDLESLDREYREYAQRRGIKGWDNSIATRVTAEIRSKIEEMAEFLIMEAESGELPEAELLRLNVLREELRESLSAVAELHAESLLGESQGPVGSLSVDSQLLQNGFHASREKGPSGEPVERTVEDRIGEEFRNRKRNYLKRFEAFGLSNLAQHLSMTIESRRGKGWTYTGGLAWVTE